MTGARVFGRAFAEAYKQASASQVWITHRYTSQVHDPSNNDAQKYAQQTQGTASASNTLSSSGLTLDEACKILNVSPPKGGEANMEAVMERFKRLFDLNDPKKGGSFYLQSKVLRARERIEMEVRESRAAKEKAEELKTGWRPKVYKDR